MWVAKVKLFDENCIFATRHKKFNIQSYEHALTHYKKGKAYFFMSCHVLLGDNDSKKKYIANLKKDKRIKKLDVNGDLTIELIKKKFSEVDLEAYNAFYNPEIIFTKPGFVDSDGWEYYEIASWNRKAITKIIKAVEKNYSGKLLSLKRTEKYELYLPRIFPKLSDKQKEALSIAVKEGYYEFPRKKELKKLAKQKKISFSTFREHLRKAENKIIPLRYRESFI
jgi:predicted DNA binding protein